MNDSDIKDKAIFILGFLAVFLTLAQFKDYLSLITVPMGPRTYTIWGLIVFLVSMLVFSAYLYALSYIQNSFGKFKENKIIKWIFKVIIFLANLFYSFALITPLLIICVSLLNSSPLGSFAKEHQQSIALFDAVSIVIIVIGSVLNARFLSKNRKETESTTT